MNKIELVYRTVGERTSEIALDLAIKNIQPDRVHIIDNVKPFAKAVQQMLSINYESDFVVFADADCLIVEDMRPWLQENTLPYVDCYVIDKFRGNIHCGVHITRIDVVREMQNVKVSENDERYILRPESRTRKFALDKLQVGKAFKPFKIFHDHCQYYRDIFVKYALRELRSRTADEQAKLDINQQNWDVEGDQDFWVAKCAIAYARNALPNNASPQATANLIANLPQISLEELQTKDIPEKKPFTLAELEALLVSTRCTISQPNKAKKVFGIGLSATGTKSLNQALNMLGLNVLYHPIDEITVKELIDKNYNLSILKDFDGITDITVAPYYQQLDRLFPHSKFILTIRDKASWLQAIEKYWHEDMGTTDLTPSLQSNPQRKMLLQIAAYDSHIFNSKKLSHLYDQHIKNVTKYFKNKPESLLVLDIAAGEGWEKLCPFLDIPLTQQIFPIIDK
jgi:Sulfotransferase domain